MINIDFLSNLYLMILCHLVADFFMQPPVMATMKSRRNDLSFKAKDSNKERKYILTWYFWLTAHAACHALLLFVFFNVEVSLIVLISHWIIDKLKTELITNIYSDQGLHLLVIICNALLFSGGVF